MFGGSKMDRAGKRRAEKEKRKRETSTYNLTKAQIDREIEKSIGKKLEEIKMESTDAAMVLTLTIPIKVLVEYYWKDLSREELKEETSIFAERMVDYYESWQNGEIDILKLKNELWDLTGIKIESVNYECKDGEIE